MPHAVVFRLPRSCSPLGLEADLWQSRLPFEEHLPGPYAFFRPHSIDASTLAVHEQPHWIAASLRGGKWAGRQVTQRGKALHFSEEGFGNYPSVELKMFDFQLNCSEHHWADLSMGLVVAIVVGLAGVRLHCLVEGCYIHWVAADSGRKGAADFHAEYLREELQWHLPGLASG